MELDHDTNRQWIDRARPVPGASVNRRRHGDADVDGHVGRRLCRAAARKFSDLARKVTPAVVNISSTHRQDGAGLASEMPFRFPEGSPFEDFFKEFRGRMIARARWFRWAPASSSILPGTWSQIIT
jgi:S1-C subfamily serine protease